MRPLLTVILLAIVAACAAQTPPPRPLQCPDPTQTRSLDGGLGGTGHRPNPDCPPPETEG